jgi:hypothetical protein
MKTEYHEGPETRKKFDEGMTKLVRAPKSVVAKEKPKLFALCVKYVVTSPNHLIT